MEHIVQKSFLAAGGICIYFAFVILLNATSENKNFSLLGVQEIFANITFDSQNPNTWYNSTNPTASVSVTPGSAPAPVAVTLITRHSH